MKLLLIWLLGVPLAVAVMCTAATLWPRGVSTTRAQARVSDTSLTSQRQIDLEPMLSTVAQ